MSSRWAYDAFKCDGYDLCPGDCDMHCNIKDEEPEETYIRKIENEMDRIRFSRCDDAEELAKLCGRLNGLGYAILILKEALNGKS